MTEPQNLDLLLCDADERAPVLPGGLPEASLRAAPAPERGPRGKDSLHLEDLAADPNDLAAQRWAVIAPEGPAGDELLAAIRALVEHRRDQQGADPIVYRVPDRMDAAAALRWKNEVLRSEDVPADERPRYLMILGDIDRVSLELQHVLANGSFVGRLHCPNTKGYRNYAEKVVARERGVTSKRPRALYYTAQDGSSAISTGYRHLVQPSMRMTADLASRGKLAVDGPTEVPHSEWGPDELLSMVGVDTPSLLVSLSHGLGAPRRGWKSHDQQRALQGALSLGAEDPLSADMVRESRFLPGGVWLCVACYGAGTPPHSAFHPWLALLAEHGGGPESAAAVLRALPKEGERPFVAALPQALLANPNGPVAVLGHMDLAWTFGFTDPTGKHSRASRMHAAQRALVSGSRAGVGLDALMHAYREVNDELMSRYQTQRDAAARGQPDPVDPRQLGDAWMQRNDLRGYVLLGDPAARLPISGTARASLAEASELQDRPKPNRPVIEVDARTAPPPPTEPPPPPAPAIAPTGETPPAPAIAPTPEASPAIAPTPESAPTPAAPAAIAPTPEIAPTPAAAPAIAPTPAAIDPTPEIAPTPAAPAAIAPTLEIAPTPAAPTTVVPTPEAAPTPAAAPAIAPTPAAPLDPAISPSPAPAPAPTIAPTPAASAAPAIPPTPPLAPGRPSAAPTPSYTGIASAPYPVMPFPPPSAAPPRFAEVPMSTPPPPSAPESPYPYSQPAVRPRALENPEAGLRERAVLAMLRGDEPPRGISLRFGLPLEELFYWLDVYREAGRRALGG